MSDLQCPARLYVGWPADGGAALEAGDSSDPASWVAAWPRLVTERIVSVYDRRGVAADLEELADLHRGEAVLVLVDSEVVGGLRRGGLVGLAVDGDGSARLPTASGPPSEL